MLVGVDEALAGTDQSLWQMCAARGLFLVHHKDNEGQSEQCNDSGHGDGDDCVVFG